MDKTTMFSLTYGLFIAGVEAGGKKNACIINTAIQATSSPMRMHVTMLKNNLTTELVKKKGSLTISVLSLDCPLDLIASFGLRSGRQFDKFDGVDHKTDGNGNPFLENNTLAYMSLNVSSVIDLDSHDLIICEVVEAEKTGTGHPMSYADYRTLKSGGAVAKTPDKPTAKRWVCSVCHYVYDGDIPFEDLPDDWVCPLCKEPKSVFVLESLTVI